MDALDELRKSINSQMEEWGARTALDASTCARTELRASMLARMDDLRRKEELLRASGLSLPREAGILEVPA